MFDLLKGQVTLYFKKKREKLDSQRKNREVEEIMTLESLEFFLEEIGIPELLDYKEELDKWVYLDEAEPAASSPVATAVHAQGSE